MSNALHVWLGLCLAGWLDLNVVQNMDVGGSLSRIRYEHVSCCIHLWILLLTWFSGLIDLLISLLMSRCESKGLLDSLCTRVLVTRDGNITMTLNVEQATINRDTLAKTIYSRLFDW